MPDSAAVVIGAESRPSRWPFRLGLACLVLAALPWLVRGWNARQADDEVRALVSRFIEDVAQGRRDSALASLSDDYRATLPAGESFPAESTWLPSDPFSFQILTLRRSSAAAEVQVVLASSGFTVKPIIGLRRQPDHTWRIARIDGVAVDPHWTRFLERERRLADEGLAEELAEKLSGTRRE